MSWLLVVPLGVWLLATVYLPIMAPFLNQIGTWVAALVFALLAGVSLVGHVAAQAWTAATTGSEIPESVPLYAFGDPAQVWPSAATAPREALVAISGPAANLLLSGLAWVIWNRQWQRALDAALLFLVLFNLLLVLVNLSPGFPVDGGRLTRAIAGGLLGCPALANRLARWLGAVVILILTVWGLSLLVRRARFSLITGTATLLVAGYFLGVLWQHRTAPDRLRPGRRVGTNWRLVRGLVAVLLFLGLFAAALSLLPTVDGLETPGFAVPVGPMVSVSPEHRYPYRGSLILTTVIEQAPILLGQWVYGHWNPRVAIVPPERIVPAGTTPQGLMKVNYQLLEESRIVAAAVALRLAGYQVGIRGEGVEVVSILPGSPASDELLPGDRIVALNDEPVQTLSELTQRIAPLAPGTTVALVVERAGRRVRVEVPLMAPAAPGERPRLGILAHTVGFAVQLPFPVLIEPYKIVGGPSAGLMFTLAVYNLVTPGDLTGGHKIAGTGTINLDGRVGSIGGVVQKVAGAEQVGAAYFLVPPANYEDARRAARTIEVVRVSTVQEAIDFLSRLPVVSTN
ncbi:MAG: PDZ domain-containing protein [Ardenticatenaceae bacterium]|nr:PDZ domain-containing protein [Ardenticatenaceae bacterium]